MANLLVANLPAIQRDLYLARCSRRVDDPPTCLETMQVKWRDMAVLFGSDGIVSEASVKVSKKISIAVFTRRMESLLDCGAKSEGAAEWTLKFSCRISDYGSVEEVRRLLCDKIATIDRGTGETVGVLKIKRRSVNAGYAKIRILPAEDSLQLVVRHTTAQGLKAVWKSVLWRLRPQYPSAQPREEGQQVVACETVATSKDAVKQMFPPVVFVHADVNDSYWREKAEWLSAQGMSVEFNQPIDVTLPLENYAGKDLPYYTADFLCRVVLRRLPAGKPDSLSLCGDTIEVLSRDWSEFAGKAKKLSEWLGLGWDLSVPAVPAEKKPE